jgi:nucleotide-binding universal stress UspA family protein
MRWKVSRSQQQTAEIGDGPADTPTVVIGIDGLPASWDAFCWACTETRRLGGRVVVVFISPAARAGLAGAVATAGLTVPGYLALDLAANEQARQLLTAMLREAGDLDLTFIDAPGDPVSQLLRVAREVHADLLVVGGSTENRRHLLGAVGPRLAARCRDSVIAVVPPSSRVPS